MPADPEARARARDGGDAEAAAIMRAGARPMTPDELAWFARVYGPPASPPPPAQTFAEAPPVTGMPGPDGKRAEQLLAASREHGIATLAELAERGVRRLLLYPKPETAGTLFDDDELERLAGTLYGAVAAGDLLGRSRVRRRADLAERAAIFSERSDPGPPGPPPRPGLTWKEETQRWVRRDDHARELERRAPSVPAQLRDRVKRAVASRYAKLERRYGPAGAKAVLSASVLMLPVPVPGASLIPVAVAEAVRAIGRGISRNAEAGDPGELAAGVIEFIRGVYAAAGRPVPPLDPARAKAAVESGEVDDDDPPPAAAFAEWRPYVGPEGGRGWTDGAEVRYQVEKPGGGATSGVDRVDIGEDDPVELYTTDDGATFWTGSHAEAKRFIQEVIREDGAAALERVVMRRPGEPARGRAAQAPPPPPPPPPAAPEPLPPPSDFKAFKSGAPVDAVVYRGESKSGSGMGMAALGHGRYFGLVPEVANIFSKPGTVKASRVRLERPAVVHNVAEMTDLKKRAEAATGLDFGGKDNAYDGYLWGDQPGPFTQALQAMGYDGIITTYRQAPGGEQVVVFPPKQGPTAFAEKAADPWHDFADPIPAVEPVEAVRYFRQLVPNLADDPVRYGPALRREAFTLAVATERTLLDRVKAAIAKGLVTGEDQTADIQAVLDDAGVTPRNPQYCFLPGTRVEGAVLAASKARYDGPAVKIKTDDGRVVAVTVNHPVLTPGGWKRAGDVQQGDDLLCYGDPVEPLGAGGAVRDGREFAKPAASNPGRAVSPQAGASLPPERRAVHDQKVPARIEDVFQTILVERSAGMYVQRPTSPLDFHGDAAFFQGDIDRVRADGVLMDGGEAACPQGFEQVVLVQGHVLAPEPTGHRGGLLPLRGIGASDAELASGDPGNNPLTCGGGHFSPAEAVNVGRAANLDPGLFKATEKRLAGDVQLVGKLLQSLPGAVSTHRVVEVERVRWAGHVYDLQTATGFIVSEGVITSNCEMVWRTNVMDALNAGAMAEMQTPEMAEVFPFWRYDGIVDERTGDDHRPHIGRYFPVARSFAEVRGARVYNCLLPGAGVSGRFFGGFCASYDGQAVQIETRSGVRLAVTAYHPVLTDRGFVPAHQLKKGDRLANCGGHVEGRVLRGDDEHGPARVEDVFDAFAVAGSPGRLSIVPRGFDFHGDGAAVQGKIEVVRADVAAVHHFNAGGPQSLGESLLGGPNVLLTGVPRRRPPRLNFGAVLLPAAGLVGGADLPGPRGRVHTAPLQVLGIGPAAGLDAPRAEPVGYDGTADAELYRELLNRPAGLVAADEIVNVDVMDYRGHVYDLSTDVGYFAANGIIISNCRCSPTPVHRSEAARLGLR